MTTKTSARTSTTPFSPVRPQARAPIWKPRLAAIAAGVVANLVYLFVVTKVADYDLKVPEVFGQNAQSVPVGSVIGASIVPALLGWGLLTLLERRMPLKAAQIWGTLAVVLLVVGLPWNGAGITTKDQLLLGVMHLIVGLAVIPTFVVTSRRRA